MKCLLSLVEYVLAWLLLELVGLAHREIMGDMPLSHCIILFIPLLVPIVFIIK